MGNQVKNKSEWLDLNGFVKKSHVSKTTVFKWVGFGKVRRRGTRGKFEYRFEPKKHIMPKKKPTHIPKASDDPLHADNVVAMEKEIRLEKKEQGLKQWGLFEKEDISWLINYARTKRVTVSEAIGRLVKHARALEELELLKIP